MSDCGYDVVKRLIECNNRIVHLVRKVDDGVAKELEEVSRELGNVIQWLFEYL